MDEKVVSVLDLRHGKLKYSQWWTSIVSPYRDKHGNMSPFEQISFKYLLSAKSVLYAGSTKSDIVPPLNESIIFIMQCA